MPQTPLGITYPDASGHTRLWEHLQTLATDADALIAGTILGDGASDFVAQVGRENSVGPSSPAASHSHAVTFPVAFGAGQVYCFPVNVNSSNVAPFWTWRAINISSTGFSIVGFSATSTPETFSATMTWLAVGPRP